MAAAAVAADLLASLGRCWEVESRAAAAAVEVEQAD